MQWFYNIKISTKIMVFTALILTVSIAATTFCSLSIFHSALTKQANESQEVVLAQRE